MHITLCRCKAGSAKHFELNYLRFYAEFKSGAADGGYEDFGDAAPSPLQVSSLLVALASEAMLCATRLSLA